jgi:hypothetical protein
MHLATVDCQIISKYLAIHGCQITSNDLATQADRAYGTEQLRKLGKCY